MTFADFELLDTGADDAELVREELVRTPPPPRRETVICGRLFRLLYAAVEQWKRTHSESRVGEVHILMGYLFAAHPASWLRPDVSVTHPNQPSDRYYEGAPLMVFEVVSPYDLARLIDPKVATYLAHGSAEVWLIYPDTCQAWVYRTTAEATRETVAIHSDLLPGIEIPLSDILEGD